MRKVLSLVGILTLSCFLSYRFGIYRQKNESLSSKLIQRQSTRASLDRCVQEGRFPEGRSPASEGPDADYYSLIEKNHLEEKNRKMMSIFPRTEVGHALAQATTLSDFEPNSELPEGKALGEFLKFLESEPDRTFALIQASIDRIPSDGALEKQFLYSLVARLDVSVSHRIEFFLEELSRSITPENKLNRINSSVILVKLMQIENDPSSLTSALRPILQSQPNYSLQTYLIGIYETKYPEEARKLRSDLGLNGSF